MYSCDVTDELLSEQLLDDLQFLLFMFLSNLRSDSRWRSSSSFTDGLRFAASA